LLVTFIPLLGVDIIQRHGLAAFYLAIVALHVLLLPYMLGIKDAPMELAFEEETPAVATGGQAAVSTLAVIMSSVVFWLIALGDGILNGTAITGSGLLLPIVQEYGVAVTTGAVFLSISGASSIVGSLVAGYACDLVGPAWTLALAGMGFALAWALIALTGGIPVLAVASFLIGFCGASVFPPISALVVQVFGFEALPRVLGLLGVMTLPFTFAMSPAAGWLRDVSGSYEAAFAMLIGTCVLAAVTFLGLGRHLSREPGEETQSPTMRLPPAEAT
jgi:MFS family permease